MPATLPQLAFSVQDAATMQHAVVPTLRFAVRIECPGGEPVRSVLLDTQIRIAARRRPYAPAVQERLLELFGTPDRWGSTLRTLPWVRTTTVVPPFRGSTVVDLPVTCTYDLEVAASRYLHALEGGDVPLEFLFSGACFYSGPGGALQVARIALDSEAACRLPVRVWRETIDRYFPGATFLRLRRDTFDRLAAYKARRAHPTWEDALEALLRAGEEG